MNFLNFMSGLMATEQKTQEQLLEEAGLGWLSKLITAVKNIIGPILIVIATVGIIYAIYLGVMLAKAESAEAREEAKKRIINVVIAIGITAALIFVMYLLANNVGWFVNLEQQA